MATPGQVYVMPQSQMFLGIIAMQSRILYNLIGICIHDVLRSKIGLFQGQFVYYSPIETLSANVTRFISWASTEAEFDTPCFLISPQMAEIDIPQAVDAAREY